MKKTFIAGSAIALGLAALAGSGVSAIEISGIKSEADLIDCLTRTSATCTLGDNINLTQATLITGDIQLNLGNYKISEGETFDHADYGMLTVASGASLNLDGEGDAGIYATTAYAAIRMTNGETYDSSKIASLTLDGGTLSGLYYGITGNGNRHNTEITINGGKVTGTKPEDNLGIYHPQTGVVNVNGGTIIGDTGIAIKSGTLNVNGGEIIATGTDNYPVDGYSNGINVAGAAIQVESSADYAGDIVLNFNGGEVTSEKGIALYEYLGAGTDTTVSKINFKKAELTGKTKAYLISEELEGDVAWIDKIVAGSAITENTDTRFVVAANTVKTQGLTDEQSVIVEKKTVLTDEEAAQVAALKIDGLAIAGIFDITVLENGDPISETENDITFAIKLGSSLSAPEGYNRSWYMIQLHDGVAKLIEGEVDEANGTVTFTVNKFSTYALGYTDTAVITEDSVAAPNTGVLTEATSSASNLVAAVLVGLTTTLAGFAVILKRTRR